MYPVPAIASRWEVDRAVAYGLLMRAWQIPAGAITAVLLALTLDAGTRGAYYTLVTFIGLQSLADSGVLNVILHAVSHEWNDLRIDAHGFLRGRRRARGRIAAIARFAVAWFALFGGGILLVGLFAGAWLLGSQPSGLGAIPALAVAIGLAIASVSLSPLIAVLEGCHQVETVNRFRFSQAIAGSLAVWAALVCGAGVWTPVVAIAVQLFWEAGLLAGRYRTLWVQLWRTAPAEFSWRREIWPLQWKVGVYSASHFLVFFPLVPTLYAMQGAAIAGLAGMTVDVVKNLAMVPYAWLRTRSPELGSLWAAGDFARSKRLLRRVITSSTLLLVALSLAFIAVLVVLQTLPIPAAGDRSGWPITGWLSKVGAAFLPATVAAWFALAMVPNHWTHCLAMHLRARKIDPIWLVHASLNLVTAGAVYFAAATLGVGAVGIAYASMFTVMAAVAWLIWRRQPDVVEPIDGAVAGKTTVPGG